MGGEIRGTVAVELSINRSSILALPQDVNRIERRQTSSSCVLDWKGDAEPLARCHTAPTQTSRIRGVHAREKKHDAHPSCLPLP